jgi:hypothetical protein
MPDEIPAELQRFVEQHVDSLAELEAILLLREDPTRTWPPAEVAKVLYAMPEMCASLLAKLARRGLLEHSTDPEAGYRYRPASAELDRLIGDLGAVYRQRRVAVITLIYSKPSSNVQSFADAFRLRKED